MLLLLFLLLFRVLSFDRLRRFSRLFISFYMNLCSVRPPLFLAIEPVTWLPFTIMLPFSTSLPLSSMKLHPDIIVGLWDFSTICANF